MPLGQFSTRLIPDILYTRGKTHVIKTRGKNSTNTSFLLRVLIIKCTLVIIMRGEIVICHD